MLNGRVRTAVRAILKKFAAMVRELLTALSTPKEGVR